MSRIWSDEAKFEKWLQVEIAACEAWAELGRVPKEALEVIKRQAGFDVKRIDEIEKEVKHDVIAFLTCVGEYVGEKARYIHLGLTSSDVIDTAFALQLRDAASQIIQDIEELLAVLKERAHQHKSTPMIGRTHGIHAEPITLGLVFALWYDDMKRNLDRIKRARDVISVGKMSGAVGTFSNVPPFIEEYVCRKLGLKPAGISTQIVQRDLHSEYFLMLALVAASVEKIALQIRHFQRTEVLELEEPFTEGQKGSSAMPHKRNPVLAENLCGLGRIVRSYATTSLENIPLWHERDISHSSVERIIAPDAMTLLDFMLHRLKSIIEGLQIHPESMERNLWLTRGLVFSQKVLLKLVDKGLSREKAYELVQKEAMEAWKGRRDFKKLILENRDVREYLSTEEIKECFDVDQDLKHVDYIFNRVFS